MKLNYDGEWGQIFAQLDDNDIRELLITNRLENQQSFIVVHQIGEDITPHRDIQNPAALLGISISNKLLDTFLDSPTNQHVSRIGGILSCELTRLTS